jgi:hypothetical protein
VRNQFNTATLKTFEKLRGCALGDEWNRKCEEIRPLVAWEWAFDFRGRGCAAPVRIVYAHDGEYAMGSWKYRLADIVEKLDRADPTGPNLAVAEAPVRWPAMSPAAHMRVISPVAVSLQTEPARAEDHAGKCVKGNGAPKALEHHLAVARSELCGERRRMVRSARLERATSWFAGRPHASLGPGVPEPSSAVARSTGHQIAPEHRVATEPILAGLHHAYRLGPVAA